MQEKLYDKNGVITIEDAFARNGRGVYLYVFLNKEEYLDIINGSPYQMPKGLAKLCEYNMRSVWFILSMNGQQYRLLEVPHFTPDGVRLRTSKKHCCRLGGESDYKFTYQTYVALVQGKHKTKGYFKGVLDLVTEKPILIYYQADQIDVVTKDIFIVQAKDKGQIVDRYKNVLDKTSCGNYEIKGNKVEKIERPDGGLLRTDLFVEELIEKSKSMVATQSKNTSEKSKLDK